MDQQWAGNCPLQSLGTKVGIKIGFNYRHVHVKNCRMHYSTLLIKYIQQLTCDFSNAEDIFLSLKDM